MVKELVKDDDFLKIKSVNCTKKDAYIIDDLKDTLEHHLDSCVGMAANMIGYSKNMIIYTDDDVTEVLINPEIIFKDEPYVTLEGCLCHEGKCPGYRFKKIKVKYLNEDFKEVTKNFDGWVAQIIQHEIDHLKGILI